MTMLDIDAEVGMLIKPQYFHSKSCILFLRPNEAKRDQELLQQLTCLPFRRQVVIHSTGNMEAQLAVAGTVLALVAVGHGSGAIEVCEGGSGFRSKS